MGGFDALAYALGMALALMAVLFVLSRLVVRYGLVPLSAALSFSGFNTSLFYLLILPGTVVHELSHYLACIVTFVRVRQLRLFSPQSDGTLGWVAYDKPDPFRRSLIALAPFIGGSVGIFLIVHAAFPAAQLAPLAPAPGDVTQSLSAAMSSIIVTLRSADLGQVVTWIVLYLLFSLSFGVAPSNDDLAPLAVYGLAALAVVIGVRLADEQFGWGLVQSSEVDSAATLLARLFQGLNGLLLFACAVVGMGALVLVPIATLVYWLRSALARH
jgi:hypothetical protein